MSNASQKYVPELIPYYLIKNVWDPWFIDVEPTIPEGGAKLFFSRILRDEDNGIDSDTMCRRAVKEVASKGLSDVPALLGPDGKGLKTIPVELQEQGTYIVLPGTVFYFSNKDQYIPCLYWDGEQWRLDFRLLDRVWIGNGYFVSCE